MEQKYKKGERVKVLVGHNIWHFKDGQATHEDIRPELKEDTATVEHTYGELSETDCKFSKGDRGYKQYGLRFDKYGYMAWFDEHNIVPA